MSRSRSYAARAMTTGRQAVVVAHSTPSVTRCRSRATRPDEPTGRT
jgi:hypothetical protein